MEAQEWLLRHTAIARGTMMDYGEDGMLRLVPSEQLTPAQRYAIESVSEDPLIEGEKMSKGRALKINCATRSPR